MPSGPEIKERDFFYALLNLGLVEDLPGLLEEALSLILGVVGAHRGYIEVRDPYGNHTWTRSSALDDAEVDVVRKSLSTGIMREALSSGETIQTASAITDPRFSKRDSVQRHHIEAAVCAPIGGDAPVGVVYLQGRAEPGPFARQDVERIELFARHLAPHADRLVRLEAEAVDPTQRWRERLKADELVGTSQALANLLQELAMVAPVDLSVLLQGPTGSGKTSVARVIHGSSPRATFPFVELNCAAIPDELVESELFGAERGAHSTATQRVQGKVEVADRGTLFLDEIAELPLTSQAKLLQFLQSGQYYPLGSPTPRRSNARIIAATNRDLEEAVAAKEFRADLYYRLNVFNVRVPGLDERVSDRILLARHFLEQIVQRHHLPNLLLSPSGRHALQVAELPSHIRELANIVERGAVVAAGQGSLQVARQHLFPSRRPSVDPMRR
ncbi:MAG: sigma-54-dependent Fis family transcriptional regulator [Alphaproteobacteria bacterium]|nr:sigma-54-dependent Fis family transcriptional regulator [Alphaproteobacteria bacterium]